MSDIQRWVDGVSSLLLHDVGNSAGDISLGGTEVKFREMLGSSWVYLTSAQVAERVACAMKQGSLRTAV